MPRRSSGAPPGEPWSARSTGRSATRSSASATRSRCGCPSGARGRDLELTPTGARRRVPERQAAAGGVRPRPVRDRRRLELDTRALRAPRPVRPPDGDRARLQPAVPALQHRPPHLRERPRVRARRSSDLVAAWPVRVRRGRADRPLDGRARGAERLPLRRRQRLGGEGPPRGHARDAPPRGPARAGHERGERRAGAPPGDPAARQGAEHPQLGDQGPPLRLPRRRVLDRSGLRRVPARTPRARSRSCPRARHYFICATLSREADAPVGRIIGDLLVLHAERVGASGARQAAPVPGRALPPPRRRQPLRPAEPPGDLRPDPPLRAEPARAAGAGTLRRRRDRRVLSGRSARARARAARAARSAAAARGRPPPTRSRRRSR